MRRSTLARAGIATLALAAALANTTASSAVAPPRASARAVKSGTPHLVVYGGRTRAQQRSGVGAKLDAALAGIAAHADRAAPGTSLTNLRALNPAARFRVAPGSGIAYVAVDAITRGDPQALKRALVGLGLEHPAVYLNDVGGWLPIAAIEPATRLAAVHSIRAALARTRSGVITSQGDYVETSAALRANSNLLGTGVKVGILSDSYDCYATYAASGGAVPANGNAGYASNGITTDATMDIASDDLPPAANITILAEPGQAVGDTCMNFGSPLLLPYGDEGRAMMQIVHDVAPGASLLFHTAVESEADFANGIVALTNSGAQIIADDVGYFDEPFFQDGLLAQAANAAYSAGVAYFSAAGNNGSNAYDNTAPDFSAASVAPAGEGLLNFDTSGATSTTAMTLNLPQLVPGEYVAIVLQWNEPFVTGAPASGGATSRMDLCLTGSATGLIASPDNPDPGSASPVTPVGNNVQVCTGANSTGVDPYQILIIGFPANAANGDGVACPSGTSATVCSAAQTVTVQVGHVGGTTPGRIKLVVQDDGAGTTANAPVLLNGGTLQGHPSATGVMAVGAVFWDRTPLCGANPPLLEYFSAQGGDPILFDQNGAPLPSPQMRQKPDIAGPDGGSDTFLGFRLGSGGSGSCINSATYPNFFGTSAATPHVAATAALLLEQWPGLNVNALYAGLKSGALTLASDTGSSNYLGGYGLLQAQAAFDGTVPPPQMSLTITPATVNVGQTATLNWTVTSADACTASGAWSGSQAASGSLNVTPSAAGTLTYTLNCTNASGYTKMSQALTVNSAGGGGGGGGGGGALDGASLLALGALAAAARRRRARGG